MANEESGESDDVTKTLRGDAVGNTLYSERWILRLLIRLTQYVSGKEEFDMDFETNLCTLWDMCAEKDVVLFLRRHGMLTLIVSTVLKSENPRLTEIMIGILGNMCTVKSVREECEQRHDIMKILMDVLSLIDAPTLIQVMRVLQTFAWDVNNTCDSLPVPHANNDLNNHVNNHHDGEQEENVDADDYAFDNFYIDVDGGGVELAENADNAVNAAGDASSSSTLSDDAGHVNDALPGLLCINGEDSLLSLASGEVISFGRQSEDDESGEVSGDVGGRNSGHPSGGGLGSCSGEIQHDAGSVSSGSESTVSRPESADFVAGGSGEAMPMVEDPAVAGTSSEGARLSNEVAEPSTSGQGDVAEAAGKASTDEEEDAEVVDVQSDSEKETFTACDLWYQQFLNVEAWLPEVRFILNSSKNDELLCLTWTLLQTVCFIRVGDTFLFSSILGADVMRCLLESHKEFFATMIDEDTNDLVNVERGRKGALVWTSIVYAFTLHQDCLDVLRQFKAEVMKRVFQVLRFYHQFLPLDDDLLEYVVQSYTVQRHILLAHPSDFSCLRSGVFDTIELLDELTASKNSKLRDNGNVTKEREAISNVQRYLRVVLGFILDNLDAETDEEQKSHLKDMHAALIAKDLVYY